MISTFTLITVIGVMLGVALLVVVMSVYSGLERDVKSRLLGFTPHVLINQPAGLMVDWRESAKRFERFPFVESATAYVSDNVIIDVDTFQRPAMFRAIDTKDQGQVDGLAKMLDKENFPSSTADLGLDDRAVISSNVARDFHIGVGSTIRLYSARNSEQVIQKFKLTENPPVRTFYADEWKKVVSSLAAAWQVKGGSPALPRKEFEESYDIFSAIWGRDIRDQEKELLRQLLVSLEERKEDISGNFVTFEEKDKAAIEKAIEALNNTDVEKMDGEILKSLKVLVLPKKVEVVGVYQASQMALTPDIFLPLQFAQDLAGLRGNVDNPDAGDDSIQGIALRLNDAYRAEEVATVARKTLGPEWSVITWGQQNETFFNLINQQRAMMYFVLSLIMLVSAFSMMAVMFTVTIQKKREIGVMKALGAAPGQIVRVFLYQGMILGVFGAVIGVVLGRTIIHFRGAIQAMLRVFGFDPFSAAFTGFGVLPAHNNPVEQLMFGIMAFVLCSVAALVPAFFASRSDAAKSLRNL